MEHNAKFLVIGGGGLVGRHVLDALAGREVTATYRTGAPAGALTLDITDRDATQRIVSETGADVIVLAAADAWVEHCERDPEITRKVNIDAPAAVADAAAKIGALLIAFSSEYVFDGTAGDYGEDDLRRPLNEYGRQKVALEDAVIASGRGLVCRTSAVFGNDPKRKNFVCQLVDRLSSGNAFDVPEDQFVTPTYAPALAEAVVALADRGASGIFHVAGPLILDRGSFAEAAARAYCLDTALIRRRRTTELGLLARRPLRCGLRTAKLAKTLGHGLIAPTAALGEMASESIRRPRPL